MKVQAKRLIAAAADWIRTVLLAVATNEMLFFFAAFLLPSVFDSELFRWYPEQVDAYKRMIVVPWGMALCLYRLERRSRIRGEAQRMDIAVLFVLLGWIVVPFYIRYGITASNASSWVGCATVYFALYAMITEESHERREKLFDQACLMFCVLSLLMGGGLLWCAWAGAWIDCDWVVQYSAGAGDRFGFGVYQLSQLCNGKHYNNTGMTSLCCVMFCLAGAERGKRVWTRALHLIAAAAMMIVIVLTQSRTARYALIVAVGAGVYGHLASTRRIPRALVRHAAGLLAAGVVMAASYVGASGLTDAALAHYAEREQSYQIAMAQEAAMEAEEEAQEAAAEAEAAAQEAAAEAEAAAQEAAVEAEAAAQEAAAEAEAAAQEAAAEAEAAAQDAAVQTEAAEKESEEPAVQPKAARDAGDKSFTGRTHIWKGLIEYWKQNPKYFVIGTGADRVGWQVADLIDWPVYGLLSMHNAYLQHTADYGLIGTALLVAFFLIITPSALRVFFAAGAKRKPGYNAMCMLVVGVLLTGMMENQPLLPMTDIHMALFVALALIAARGNELKKEN